MTEVKKKRKFGFVEASRIHPSRLLPGRESDDQLVDSIRRDGIQQPIIVRPSPHEKGMYEIIDGHLRYETIQKGQKVLVDVRYGANDAGVFKISEATFKRKPRTTYERSLFYSRWVKTLESTSQSPGAQRKVAKEANLNEAVLSNYLSIARLFKRLRTQSISEENFNALKSQSINKLYALAKMEANTALLEVAETMATEPKITLEKLKILIEERTSPYREIERLEEEVGEEENETGKAEWLTNTVQELEGALHETRKTLTVFTSRIANNPRRFLSPDIIKRIRRMLNTLKKIEKEANQILRSGKKADPMDKCTHGM